jgi:hypothetical protein
MADIERPTATHEILDFMRVCFDRLNADRSAPAGLYYEPDQVR